MQGIGEKRSLQSHVASVTDAAKSDIQKLQAERAQLQSDLREEFEAADAALMKTIATHGKHIAVLDKHIVELTNVHKQEVAQLNQSLLKEQQKTKNSSASYGRFFSFLKSNTACRHCGEEFGFYIEYETLRCHNCTTRHYV